MGRRRAQDLFFWELRPSSLRPMVMTKSVQLVSGYSNPRLWHNLFQDSSFHQNLPMRRIDSVFADLRCANGI